MVKRRTHNAASKFPEKPRNADLSVLGQISPIRMLMAHVAKKDERKRYEKEVKDYQDSLKGMGMFDEGGGRANVKKKRPPKKGKSARKMKPLKVAQGGRIKGDGVCIRGKTKGTIR